MLPTEKAGAYDIYWRYGGYGYLAATTEDNNGKPISKASNDATTAERDVYINPQVSQDNKSITWEITFNPKGYNKRELGSSYGKNFADDSGINRPFGTNPTLYAFLPNGLDKSSITVERIKYYFDRDRMQRTHLQRAHESYLNIYNNANSCDFSSTCDGPWNNSVGPASGDLGVGAGQMSHISYMKNGTPTKYSVKELYAWKNEGKFGVGFFDKININYGKGFAISPEYHWRITAKFDNNHSADDLYRMPIVAGFTSERDRSKGAGNSRKNKFMIIGPFDSDGDGIPDNLSYRYSMHPNDTDQIKYPVYRRNMLKDFSKPGNSTATDYGWTDNVPITTYGTTINVKPFSKIINWGSRGNWNTNWFGDPKQKGGILDTFSQDTENLTTTDLPVKIDEKHIEYRFNGKLPSGVREDNGTSSGCNVSRDKGCVKIDRYRGKVTYNPLPTDWKRKTRGQDDGLLTFSIEIKYPAPGSFNLDYGNNRIVRSHPLTIRVLPQASLHSPKYNQTEADFNNIFNNGKDSEKPFNEVKTCNPDSVLVSNAIAKYGKNYFPKDTKFELARNNKPKRNTYYFGGNEPIGDETLSWSDISKNHEKDGIVHFAPSKVIHPRANPYNTPVIVRYPDGSTSEDLNAGNVCNGGKTKGDKQKSVVYAPVKVTRHDPIANDLHLDLHEGNGMHDSNSSDTDHKMYRRYSENDYKNIRKIDADKKIVLDSWSWNGIGKIKFRAVCHEENDNKSFTVLTPPDGEQKSSGSVKRESSGNQSSAGIINGLRFTDYHSWDHASESQERECKRTGKCNVEPFVYNYLISDSYNVHTLERSRAVIDGKPKKSGNFECKVYAFHEGSDWLKKFDSEAKNAKNHSKLFDFGANYNSGSGGSSSSSAGSSGGFGSGSKRTAQWADNTFKFSVKLEDNQRYNPTYVKIPTVQAGAFKNQTDNSSSTPKSYAHITVDGKQVTANGVSEDDLGGVEDDVPLPKGTWFSIKRFVKAGDISNSGSKSLPWANFEGGEDNKAEGKLEAKDKNATGKGSVTFRPDKWQDEGEYWAEVVVHYPDGSSTDQEDSINYGHPVYAKVKVTRPAIGDNDLHLNVYKQYENGKFTGPVDSTNGIVVMKGVGLLKDMGIDSWSTAKRGGITLRALCRDDSDEAKKSTTHTWSENLDSLFFKLNWQKAWDHADFQQQETCRKSGKKGDGCNPEGKYLLFDTTGDTMERASGTITSSKAPTKSGKYYCVVLAMKLEDLSKYKDALKNKNGKISVTDNDFAKAIGFTDKSGVDYAVKFFPVTVVDKFALPKTGGHDRVNWNLVMSVVCVIGTGVMAVGFFLEQTKWGRAVLEALLLSKAMLLRKAVLLKVLLCKALLQNTLIRNVQIKDFICKTAKKLRALRRRSERRRC
ncbi:hypothetical protein ACMZ7D_04675 [Gardnerella vaginalis]|uniref:hypothetical protein n=1 Tax=Gardnerella vaginalis TaxID=2702 RepID=UPI0039F0BBC8